MRIDPTELGAERIYRLMTGIVVPRPIAWVTSLSRSGVLNLAPFSAFTFVSQKPPMLAISAETTVDERASMPCLRHQGYASASQIVSMPASSMARADAPPT